LELVIWVDGASMPNPGPSGAGLLVLARGRSEDWLFGCTHSLGIAGNNQAELTALREAVAIVGAVQPARALILSDSQVGLRLLLHGKPVPLDRDGAGHRRTQTWLQAAGQTSLCWVPRSHNLAHHLAQAAAQGQAHTSAVQSLGRYRRALSRAV
jgi:ribonuclease HI